MDKKRIVLVVGVAVLLAFLASAGIYKFLSERSRVAEQARLETVGIVVAVVDIPMGATINPNMVAVSAWPKSLYPKDAFADPKALDRRVARRDFQRGEPIVQSKLVPTEKGSGLMSLRVPSGQRAFSVRVNEVVGVGGFIVPDVKVDVVVTTSDPNRPGEPVSKIVLENAMVLAAGQVIEQKDNKPITVNTVTLSLSPEEAEKLALASNEGKIQLILRNFLDNDNVLTTGVDKRRLLASYRGGAPLAVAEEKPKANRRVAARQKPAVRPGPSERKTFTVEVLRGNKRTEEKFSD